MNILITGANGFLGRHLIHYLSNKSYKIFAINRGGVKGVLPESITYIDVDLTNENLLEKNITKLNPAIIIHTAAMSKPNECENNKDLCILNNVSVVKYLTNICKKINSKLIFTSSDFVFGNGKNYREGDICEPLNFYGATKLMAETIIIETAINYCIIRPVFIYGKSIAGISDGFVQWVAQSLKEKRCIKVVDDQLRTATYVTDICKAIEQIIIKNATGIFNIAGQVVLTPNKMAIMVAEHLNLDKNLIIAVDESSFPEPVIRAKECVLNIDKAKEQLDFKPISFKEGLGYCF